MTQPTVGFGGTTAGSYATVSALIKAHASPRFQNSINMASPIFGTGFLEKEDAESDEWEHTIFGGAFGATQVVRDAGQLSQPEAKIPFILRQQPANVLTMLSMGRRAAKTHLRTEKLAQLFDSALEEASNDCGRVLGRQFHGGAISPQNVATWTAITPDATVSIDFNDISLFRVGSAYDFQDLSSTKAYVVRCQDITLNTVAGSTNSDAIAGTVTFINDVINPVTGAVVSLTDTAIATGDTFRTRGETAGFGGAITTVGNALNNFSDLAGSGTLFGQTPGGQLGGYRGHTKTLGASYSQEAVVQFMGRIWTNSGIMPNRVACHPQVLAAHQAYTGQQGTAWGLTAGVSAQRPVDVDTSMDKFGNVYEKKVLSVGGADMMGDPNCPAGSMALWNSEMTKLEVWDEMGPEEEAGDALLLGRTFFDVGAQISGGYNMVTYKRSTNGLIQGITNL